MRYIHRSSLKSHGNLKSSACLVDSRWTVKLSGFGLQSLTRNKTAVKGEDESKYAELIWTAPEILMLGVKASQEGTDKGDVYSFGILLQEILYRNSFFFGSDVSAEGRPMCRQSRFFFFFIRLLLPVVATSDCPSPYVLRSVSASVTSTNGINTKNSFWATPFPFSLPFHPRTPSVNIPIIFPPYKSKPPQCCADHHS